MDKINVLETVKEIVAVVFGLQIRALHVWLICLSVLLFSAGVLFFLEKRGQYKLGLRLSHALLAAVFVFGFISAWNIKWLADDAFISFTYAKRWAEGYGLVFNPGERVEGFTNFLWTILLGVFGRIGFDIPRCALFLSLASWTALVAAAFTLTRRRAPSVERATLVLPLAAMAVAFTRPFYTFATCGLETSFALALAAWATAAWRAKRFEVSSVLFAAAAMARPDHILLACAVWTVEFFEILRNPRDRFRQFRNGALRFVAPTLILFGIFWVLRWQYYGDPFPNTFYAKSGGDSYYSQGLVYLTQTLFASGFWIGLLFVIYGLWATRNDDARRPLVRLAVAVMLTHGHYVVRVGGDFMEFRVLLPTLFFLLIAWDAACASLFEGVKRPQWKQPAMLIGICAVWAFPALNLKTFGPMEKRWRFTSEETFYQVGALFPEVEMISGLPIKNSSLQDMGQMFKNAMGADAGRLRLAVGCVGMVSYYSGAQIVDMHGLTSREIARLPLKARGFPGHERHATLESLIAERADICQLAMWPGRADDLRISIAGRDYYLMRSTPELAAVFRKHGVAYPDIDALIKRDLETFDKDALLASRDFYARFLVPPESARVSALFDQALKGADLEAVDPSSVDVADVPNLLRRAEGMGRSKLATALARRVVFRQDFETAQKADNPLALPVDGALYDAIPIVGYQGRKLINTFQNGDAGTVQFELSLPSVPGQGVLDMLTAGSDDCKNVFVALFDGNRELKRWCGRNDKQMRRVSFAFDRLDAPRLQVVDHSKNPWGFLLLDDVMVAISAGDLVIQASR